MPNIEEEKKEDRRVRRTKRQLKRAFITLLREKPVQKITVRELSDIVDINRGTFYQHYKDVYDLMEKLETEALEMINTVLTNEEITTHVYPLGYLSLSEEEIHEKLTRFIALFQANYDVVAALMGPNGNQAFIHRVEDTVREHFLKDWMRIYTTKDAREADTTEEAFNYLFAFVSAGCVGLVKQWAHDGCRETPEELSTMLISLFKSVVSHRTFTS